MSTHSPMMNHTISQHIFRAYDIRGIYQQDISPDLFYQIGVAAGTYLLQQIHGKHMAVGNDIRTTSTPLAFAFISGVTSTGVHVLSTGTTSFGQTLFTGWKHNQDIIAFITASHLPADWNGIKFYYGDGVGLPEHELMHIRDLVFQPLDQKATWDQVGQVTSINPKQPYQEFFKHQFRYTKTMRVALDCGGASTTLSAPDIFMALGLDLVPVFCEPDPTFSKRPSDPKPKNLTQLVSTITQQHCDFGVAFDGDGDRAVIVDNKGKILSADETGIIIGKYGKLSHKGTVIVNVECSKAVPEHLEPLGYRVKQIQVGHTFLTLEAKKEHASLGIESSGHLIMPQYFLFDDALVVPLKIAEILDQQENTLNQLAAQIPIYPRIKEEINCHDTIKFEVIKQLEQEFSKHYHNMNTLDGIRIDLAEGWVLIRASNTSPIIRLTAEANTKQHVEQIAANFSKQTQTMIDIVTKNKI